MQPMMTSESTARNGMFGCFCASVRSTATTSLSALAVADVVGVGAGGVVDGAADGEGLAEVFVGFGDGVSSAGASSMIAGAGTTSGAGGRGATGTTGCTGTGAGAGAGGGVGSGAGGSDGLGGSVGSAGGGLTAGGVVGGGGA